VRAARFPDVVLCAEAITSTAGRSASAFAPGERRDTPGASMPFPLLAHQAVVLPLKLARPRWFSGTALCIGSLAPDLEYLGPNRVPGAGHTVAGMLVTVPWTVVLTLLTVGVAPAVLARFRRLEAIGVADRSLPVITISAVVGVASHLVLDGGTHAEGWATRWFPAFLREVTVRHTTMSIVRFIHYGGSVALSLAAVAMLASLVRRGPAGTPAPARPNGRLALVVSAVVGAWLGARWSRPILARGWAYSYEPQLHSIGYTLFAAVCFAWAGLTLTAIWLSRSDASRSRKHAARPYSV
jgi:hypothetical protein